MQQTQQTQKLSPVDQVLALDQGKSLLDTRRAGEPVPKWLWLLPLSLLLPGGILAWLIVRDRNRDAGIVMLVVGVVMTVLTVLTPLLFGDILGGLMPGSGGLLP